MQTNLISTVSSQKTDVLQLYLYTLAADGQSVAKNGYAIV